MSSFTTMSIAASGLTAQRLRMDLIANNLSKLGTAGKVDDPFLRRLQVVIGPRGANGAPPAAFGPRSTQAAIPEGVRVLAVAYDAKTPTLVSEPNNVLADGQGMVAYASIDPVMEMVDLLAASRAYEASASAFAKARDMAQEALDMIRR